jgi:hypothetical protein
MVAADQGGGDQGRMTERLQTKGDGADSPDEDKGLTWLGVAVLLSALWVLAVCAIAMYEGMTVDPWTFIGENRAPIFYSWTRHAPHTSSSFGDAALVFDTLRFWAALVAPIIAVLALSALVAALARLIREAAARR